MDSKWLYERLAQLIATAERDYTTHTAGGNVCQIQKQGRVTGGMKYDEGRFIALHSARRLLLPSACGADQAAYQTVIAEELARWRASLQLWQANPRPAIPWVAYYQGGSDALEALSALLAEGQSG